MGLGWKRWTRERLPADELQGYLQDQVVAVFPSNSVRDAELGVSDVPEGMHVHVIESGRTLVRVGVGVGGSWQIVGPYPGTRVGKAGVQNIALNTWALVNWDIAPAARLSNAGMWSAAAPSRLVAVATGRHRVSLGLNGGTHTQVRLNAAGASAGGVMVAADTSAEPAYRQAHSDEFWMNLGDYVEAFGFRSNAAGDIGTSAGYPAFFALSYTGR